MKNKLIYLERITKRLNNSTRQPRIGFKTGHEDYTVRPTA